MRNLQLRTVSPSIDEGKYRFSERTLSKPSRAGLSNASGIDTRVSLIQSHSFSRKSRRGIRFSCIRKFRFNRRKQFETFSSFVLRYFFFPILTLSIVLRALKLLPKINSAGNKLESAVSSLSDTRAR